MDIKFFSKSTENLDKKVVDEITERNSIEKRGFVAVGEPRDGSQRYVDMKQEKATPTAQVYGNRP
tara:strand:- start:2398 stop:2592 length:195 start_codon:yes stop_codon:yes gene_type:complete